jgi:hypothetical protein
MISRFSRIPDNLSAAVENCDSDLNAIVNEEINEQHATPCPPTLYHYTDGPGLLGTLKGTLHLSEIFSLNDPSELTHGLKIGSEALTARATGTTGETLATLFANDYVLMAQRAARFYVLSFSYDADELSQWRAYADNGRGFVLGFNGPELERMFQASTIGIAAPNAQNSTIAIKYDDACLRRRAEGLADVYVKALAAVSGLDAADPIRQIYENELANRHAQMLMHLSLLFKHKAYEREREYRFLHIRHAASLRIGVKTRARGSSSIVPFVEFEWKTPGAHSSGAHLLQNVVMGPALKRKDGDDFLSLCHYWTDALPATVGRGQSPIPYRG